jgi:hypothetical protein
MKDISILQCLGDSQYVIFLITTVFADVISQDSNCCATKYVTQHYLFYLTTQILSCILISISSKCHKGSKQNNRNVLLSKLPPIFNISHIFLWHVFPLVSCKIILLLQHALKSQTLLQKCINRYKNTETY